MEEMETAGIHLIGVYIRSRKATISERLDCRPIYELCIETEQILGTIQLV